MEKTTKLVAALDAGSGAENDLATACRYTAELIRTAGGPLRHLSVRWAQTAIEMEWPLVDPQLHVPPSSESVQAPSPHSEQPSASRPEDNREYICAPLVGTFYRAAQPGGKPFVEVGDYVEPGAQVAIVEAMKLMNPVEADRSGRVMEFVLPDGAAVEYGQPLIAIVPSV
jgi:acetyl-CoA carboxylase biotin carboxyl carrier protein